VRRRRCYRRGATACYGRPRAARSCDGWREACLRHARARPARAREKASGRGWGGWVPRTAGSLLAGLTYLGDGRFKPPRLGAHRRDANASRRWGSRGAVEHPDGVAEVGGTLATIGVWTSGLRSGKGGVAPARGDRGDRRSKPESMTPAMGWSAGSDALRGRVAVVAGATRGAGRGIAAAVGEAGATVICTGRSTRSSRSDYNRAETIEETAELVTNLGGTGIAAAVDHLVPDQVKRLAEQIRSDHGHIHVLVNDIWGAELLKGGPADWNTPIWEHDLDKGLRILRLAIDTHLITSHHLLPLLVDEPGGLLVEVTDGTAEYNASRYRLSVFYDLAKVAVNRLAFSQGHELEPYGATAVAITPGWLRSEMMLDNFGVSERNWRDAIDPPAAGSQGPSAPADFALSESPRYVGRAVAVLASDPGRARWNQCSVSSGQLALEYGFTDVDGTQPDIWRYIEEVGETGVDGDPDDYR